VRAYKIARFRNISVMSALIALLTNVQCVSHHKNRDRDIPYSLKTSTTPFMASPSDKTCGGFPRLRIETKSGYCVSLIKQLQDPAFQPRVILEIPGKPGEFLVSDFAGWSGTSGKIWYLKPGNDFSKVQLEPIVTNLSIVHQLAVGPEGMIYFSEDSRIRAFRISEISGSNPIASSKIITVLDNLPPAIRNKTKNSMHPIKNFIFDRSNNLIVNIGAYTDHCTGFLGNTCDEADLSFGKGSSDSHNHGAVLRLYPFNGSVAKGWNSQYRLIAEGLRNSMGLLFTPNGDLLQTENSRDFNESFRPAEELNLIPKEVIEGVSKSKHYGWPYCYEYDQTSEEWANGPFNCNPRQNSNYEPPFLLLPPHGSPLGLIRYKGTMFPELKDKLLISLHGYRSPGHRLIAVTTANGNPITPSGKGSYLDDDLGGGTVSIRRSFPSTPSTGEFDYIINGWYEAPQFRPKGSPVAITEASDGSIYIADDKSNSILRLAKPGPGFVELPGPIIPNLSKAYNDIIKESPRLQDAYHVFVEKVVKSDQCRGCHDSYENAEDKVVDEFRHLRYLMSLGTWVVPGNLEKSTLYTKLNPPMKSAMPPIDQPYKSLSDATSALESVKNFILSFPPSNQIWQVKSESSPITGLKKGVPGNQQCAVAPKDHHVFAISNNPMVLGGKKVIEIQIGRPSALVQARKCDSFNAFYMNFDDLKKL
jgi:glucose/arabinose dehydrogenase